MSPRILDKTLIVLARGSPRSGRWKPFEFAFQPSIPAALIREMAELGFLARGENILLVGAPDPTT